MKDLGTDPKQKAILKSAWTAFATYGFRKTSMDDIARGAGMSRPALYLHYRNKEDIFRSLAQYYYDDAAECVAEALSCEGPVAEVLAGAFKAQGGGIVEAMLTSPHGMELLDAGTTTAPDIAQDGEARLRGLYADWLAAQAEAGRVHLPGPPDAVAATMTAALKGIKSSAPGYVEYQQRVAQLAKLIGGGLQAG